MSDAIGAIGQAVDVTAKESVRAVAELALRAYGEIDVWFSNAGYAGPRQPGDLQDDWIWELGWQLHVMAHVHAAREVLPSMLRRDDGYLPYTASVVALATQPDKAAYAVTKHAALALAEWLATSCGPRNQGAVLLSWGDADTYAAVQRLPGRSPIPEDGGDGRPVADRLVQAIEYEHFLILDSSVDLESLSAKAKDYEQWTLDSSSNK